MASSPIGLPERATQARVVALFRDELGYRYLGDWTDRAGNSNLEEGLLSDWLSRRGHTPQQISRALQRLRDAALNHPASSLYDNNKAVYSLLRYGVPVREEAGRVTETVAVVDWERPQQNDFAIAEEVTLRGGYERRPDLVLYLNGIAVAVIELKNSRVSIGQGIRQNLSNQQPEFNAWFFSTVQLVIAGNDSEGLQYGAIGTPEKYFLTWKEDEADNSRFKLDKYLLKLCAKARLLEIMQHFVLFDGGVKKLPRVHQYFAVKAAQRQVADGRGGIIWHTQGSGKSIVMVLLARWILERLPQARVAIVTDRDELDKQIQSVFAEAGEAIVRSSSGADLMRLLGQPRPRLLCSLIHKFGRKGVDDFEQYLRELQAAPSPTVGQLFVFVDECHRSQSGKLHRVMKALMPQAVFVGFTGTPLLKEDKQTSLEVFGGYIHTYKFSEAVEDKIVLDLVYEARDIDQRLGSPERIDAWFGAKTRGLNHWQRAALREQWGTLQRVLSSRSRMERVVQDIVFDFSVKPRLSNQRGNAILVAASIYDACKYFELFQKTPLGGHCAVVTSYDPQARDVTLEETGANTETDKQFIYHSYQALLQGVAPQSGKSRTETYEDQAKDRFRKQPALMRLLIVVDKLLTGFDAPSCTYLYIDKAMQDHGLFQAICRTNRLDGDDKDFGHIVDYKDLFKKVENAIAVYTAELDHSDGGPDPQVLLQDRLAKGRERLDEALEALALICEPVPPPRGELEHIHHFCGNIELPEALAEREPQRAALYKATVALVRAFAAIADELEGAGYSPAQRRRIPEDLDHYLKLRELIRLASGETLDLKAYEADMRHLLDTYISAEEPRKISPFDDLSLLDLVVRTGLAEALGSLPPGLKGNQDAVAETIANNVRSKIVREQLSDPAYYEKMSVLLGELIEQRRSKAIAYEEFLRRIALLVKQVAAGQDDALPEELQRSPGLRAVYHTLVAMLGAPAGARAGAAGTGSAQTVAVAEAVSVPSPALAEEPGVYQVQVDQALELARRVDAAVKRVRPDGWRGVAAKEQVLKQALWEILKDVARVEQLFAVIKAQPEY